HRACDEAEELERRQIRAMEIVEEERNRAPGGTLVEGPCEGLEHANPCRVRVEGWRRRRVRACRGKGLSEHALILRVEIAGEAPGELGPGEERRCPRHLQASPPVHFEGLLARDRGELEREPRLADAGGTGDEHQPTTSGERIA